MDPFAMDVTSTEYDYGVVVHPTDRPLDIPSGVSVYEWVAISLYALVIILGVPGNGLVVWITGFEMKRSVNTVWFLNLAVADLLCCLSVPFAIMNITVGWPLGLVACKFIPSILLINMFASILLLTMISIDRCALVMRPVWCQNHRTLRKAYVACAVMWILAIILSSPSFIFRNVNSHGNEKCVQDYLLTGHGSQRRVENVIAISRLLLGFIIPFLVIVTCYSILIKRVKDRFTQNTKTMKVVLVVIIGFFICWLPYHVAGIILASHTSDSKSELYQFTFNIDSIFVAIAFMNSCINPIIYVLMGQDVKSKFRRSIRLILKNVLAEEVSQSVLDSKKSKSISETKNTEASV